MNKYYFRQIEKLASNLTVIVSHYILNCQTSIAAAAAALHHFLTILHFLFVVWVHFFLYHLLLCTSAVKWIIALQ